MNGFSLKPQAAFRGQRDYYHSTDLYEAIVQGLLSHSIVVGSIDLKIRDRIVSQPEIAFASAAMATLLPKAVATARAEVAGGDWLVQVVAGADPIRNRKAYDETPIWSRTRREDKAFTAEGCIGATPIEVVTAVAVQAHRELLPPPAGSRWLLAQLTTTRLLAASECEYFRFDLVRQVGRNMTQSNLSDRQGVFGKMIFLLK